MGRLKETGLGMGKKTSPASNVSQMEGDLIHLGCRDNVFYLDEINWTVEFQDVFLISNSGKRFGFNRCMVACLSPVGHAVFIGLADSNLDDTTFVSTDFTNEELELLQEFFHHGNLPETLEEAGTVFRAMAIDMANFTESNQGLEKDFGLNAGLESDLSTVLKVELESVDDISAVYEDSEGNDENDKIPNDFKKPQKRKAAKLPSAGQKRKYKTSDQPCQKEDEDRFAPSSNGLFDFPQDGPRDLSKLYQCERCTRGFKSASDYRMHFHRHDLGMDDYSRAWICVRCMSFEAGSVTEIKRHEKSCQVKRHDDIESKFTYYCAICLPGRQFNASNELHAHHTREHLNEKGSFVTCPSCGKQSTNPDFIRSHTRGEGPYHDGQCAQCPMKFSTWEEHSEHIAQVHNGVFMHACGYCGINSFNTEEEKICHKYFCRISKAPRAMRQVEVGSAQCTECDQVIQHASQRKARSHFLEYHSHLAQKCEICSEKFFDERLLKSHISQMHSGRRFKCDACDKDYPTKSLLRCHQAVHQERRFSCDMCPMTFHTKSVLKSHMKSVHDEKARELRKSKTKMCDHCGVAYPEDTFQAHMKRKHGGQSIQCQECNATFNHQSIYLKHIKNVHTFVCCESCGQNVKKGHYKQHVLVHHTALSEMPFQCLVCQKGFSSKDKFLTHQNIHTGLRPHNCKFCDRTFKDPSNCSKHMRESHPTEYAAYKNSNRSSESSQSSAVLLVPYITTVIDDTETFLKQ